MFFFFFFVFHCSVTSVFQCIVTHGFYVFFDLYFFFLFCFKYLKKLLYFLFKSIQYNTESRLLTLKFYKSERLDREILTVLSVRVSKFLLEKFFLKRIHFFSWRVDRRNPSKDLQSFFFSKENNLTAIKKKWRK